MPVYLNFLFLPRWPAARAIRRVARKVGRFAHRAVRQVARVVTKPLKSVKKCYRTGVKAVHGIRRFLGDGGADQHTIESLRKLREQVIISTLHKVDFCLFCLRKIKSKFSEANFQT